MIYGTVRLIERDDETVLAWAREPWACIVFNLHVDHTPEGLARAADAFRRLIDRALAHGGSFYLTYHRWATREQVDSRIPSVCRVLTRETALRPGRALSVGLVPALPGDVQGRPRRSRRCLIGITRVASDQDRYTLSR